MNVFARCERMCLHWQRAGRRAPVPADSRAHLGANGTRLPRTRILNLFGVERGAAGAQPHARASSRPPKRTPGLRSVRNLGRSDSILPIVAADASILGHD